MRGDDNGQVRIVRHDIGDIHCRFNHLLKIVEHQDAIPGCKAVPDCRGEIIALEPKCATDFCDYQSGLLHCCQRYEEGVGRFEAVGHGYGKARFPDTGCSGDGD